MQDNNMYNFFNNYTTTLSGYSGMNGYGFSSGYNPYKTNSLNTTQSSIKIPDTTFTRQNEIQNS